MNTTNPFNPETHPHSHAFQKWLNNEKSTNGLVDFRFTRASEGPVDPEAFAKELLEMIHAPAIPDPGLF